MSDYVRRRGEGGTFAFTVCLADRRRTTLTDEIDVLRDAYRATRAARPFRTDALCILPDHLHVIWTLPAGDTDYSGRWSSFKRRVTNRLGRSVWPPRFWEHAIRDDRDLANHVNYIHANPVRHGHVRTMDDWPHSTWHRWRAEHARPWTPPRRT